MSGQKDARARSIAVLAAAYVAGLFAYPRLPGPFLADHVSSRVLVAFGLPTTALVIYTIFRSLWTHDRVRSGNGAFEATYAAIVFRCLLFVAGLHALVMIVLDSADIDRQPAPPHAAQRRRRPPHEADDRQRPGVDTGSPDRRLRDGVLGHRDRHRGHHAVGRSARRNHRIGGDRGRPHRLRVVLQTRACLIARSAPMIMLLAAWAVT